MAAGVAADALSAVSSGLSADAGSAATAKLTHVQSAKSNNRMRSFMEPPGCWNDVALWHAHLVRTTTGWFGRTCPQTKPE